MDDRSRWLAVALELRDQSKYHAREAFKLEGSDDQRIHGMSIGHDAAAKVLQSMALSIEKGWLEK